jgi:hypothetical protein
MERSTSAWIDDDDDEHDERNQAAEDEEDRTHAHSQNI